MQQILFKSLIDVDKWNEAGWKGAAFFHDPTGEQPPCLGLAFENIEAGKQIFTQWHERLGSHDEHEELRISIIEGEILGQDDGYSMHISSNPANTAQRRQLPFSTAIVISRSRRMETPNSPHLARFKEEFARHKRYSLIPVSLRGEPSFELSIEKAELLFRQTSDITPKDLDAVVFPDGYFDCDSTVH
jgi:hypothetical protein